MLLSYKKKKLSFSDHSIRVAYLGFHTLLYFEHQVFLVLDVFSYYNADTRRNQNMLINEEIIVFCFTCSSVS